MMRVYNLTATTTALGAATATAVTGRGLPQLLYAVEWIDGDLAAGVDAVLSVTDNGSGVDYTLLTLTNANDDKWYYPSTVEADTAGANRTTTTKMVVQGTLKLVIADGGDTKTGGAYVYTVDV